MDRNKVNYYLDGLLGVLLLASAFSWRSPYAHIALGTSLVLVVTIHVWLHRRWVVGQTRRVLHRGQPLRGRAGTNLLVDLFIGAMFVASTLSGVAIQLSSAPLWTGLHSASSWSMFLGCGVHLALHARWVARSTRRLLTAKEGTSAGQGASGQW